MGIRQISLITCFVVGSACSGFSGSDPAPVAPVPVASPVERSVDPATAPTPTPEVLTSPSADEIRVAADSAADAAVLEQLALAGATSEISLEPFAASGSALDLTTYASHSRVQYYLDFFQGPARDRMNVWLGRLPVYESLARTRFEAAGLPSDLIYLAIIESGFSNVAVSRSRAVGMWQFMAPTGRWMGLRVDSWVDERRDPVRATDAAARYLVYLRDRFGSIYLAAAAYNGGPGTVSRGLTRGGVAPVATQNGEELEGNDEVLGWSDADFFTLADSRHLRSETKDYVPKLIAASLIAREPLKYGFAPLPAGPVFPLDSVVVPDMTGLDIVAELAGVSVAAIRELNPHYLRMVTPPGTAAVIRVPAGTAEKVATGYARLPASKRIRYREHSVRKGETLGAISGKYGVSVADIRMANPAVRKTSLIRIGQVLVIPTAGGTVSGGSSAAPAKGSATSHVVRSGETLSTIGSRYGVSTGQLIAWNRLPSNGLIKPGQRLRLTAPETSSAASSAGGTKTHLVKRGETLAGIARRYGVTVNALQDVNGIASPKQLQAGKRIKIPS